MQWFSFRGGGHDKLKSELVLTQKALIAPKATLGFTFAPKGYCIPPGETIRHVSLPVKDNVINVEYALINDTNVLAMNPEVQLTICEQCEFAIEPVHSIKVPGQSKSRRSLKIKGVYPQTSTPVMSAAIKVPPNVAAVTFGINYRCETCDIPDPQANLGIIKLVR